MRRLRAWIRSLPPYPSLALFSVPVILLEPVKFVAAYAAATGNFIVALFTFAFGELLKLVLIERLFDLTREKLMKISAFAWIYGHYVQALEWILQSEAWRTIRLMETVTAYAALFITARLSGFRRGRRTGFYRGRDAGC